MSWQASALYAVAFCGYVAFSVCLPTYLKTGYGLTQADAANRTAGFVILAVTMRPIGGWLSDRLGPGRVLAGSLVVVVVVVVAGAVTQAFTPALAPLGTLAFLAMAAVLGAGSGATSGSRTSPSPRAWCTHFTLTLLRMAAAGRLPGAGQVTHTFTLDRMEEAYDVFARAADTGALKVVLGGPRRDVVEATA